MATLLFFVFLYLIVKGIKAAIRTARARRRQRGTPERGADPLAGKLASLDALQRQREIIESEIDRLESEKTNCAVSTPENPAITNRLETIEKMLKNNKVSPAARRAYETEKAQLEILLFENGGVKTKDISIASAETIIDNLKNGQQRQNKSDPGKTALQLARLYGQLATVENKISKLIG